jgi:hypothetical protein
MAVAAVDGGRGAQGGEGAAAAAEQQAGEEAEAADGASSSSAAQQQQQQQLSDRLSSTHETGVLVGPLASGSGIAVDDMDSLEDLITDLDLLLPGGASDDTDSLGQSMGSPGPCEVERKTEQL